MLFNHGITSNTTPSAAVRGGGLVLLACLLVAACESGVFDVNVGVVPASIMLDVTDVELVSGSTAVVRASVQDAAGKPINVGNGVVRVEWTSSDDWIASVSPLGTGTARVSGGAGGDAEITATVTQSIAQAGFLALLQGGPKKAPLHAAVNVHVRPAEVVYMSGSGQTGDVGSTLAGELVVRAVDADGNGVPNVDIDFVPDRDHGSLAPAKVVTDDEGRARSRWTLGDAAGEMRAEARAHNRLKFAPIEFTATATATEDPSAPASVEVSPKTVKLNAIGDTVELSAVVRDDEGNPVPDQSVSWTSKNTGIATVDAAGRVVAKKAGRAQIVASVASVMDSAAVDVEQLAAAVTVTPGSATLTTGESKQFAAAVTDSNDVAIPEPTLAWTSSNTDVATVDASGKVTTHDAGSATLTASSDDASGTATVTVEQPAAPPPPSSPPPGILPAFPGAEGWGATALNECRGLPLAVHKVTNTNDSGTGSFRDILTNRLRSDRYDVVIFTTGGTIALDSRIETNASCLYVAGQTAPGDGIMIRSSGSAHPQLVRIVTNSTRGNIVFRYLRFRHGFPSSSSGGGLAAIGSGGGHDIVFDHISTSWAGGGGHIQINRTGTSLPTVRTSIQNSIMAEGIQNRAAMINDTRDAENFYHHSFHRNLTATAGQRHPRIHAGDAHVSTTRGVEVVNNVNYNASNRFVEGYGRSVIDLVGNYQDPSPHHGMKYNTWESQYGYSHPIDPDDTGSIYAVGNHLVGFSGSDFQAWRVWTGSAGATLPSSMQRSARVAQATFPITPRTAQQARDWVLQNAGASRKVDCSGDWVWNRDAVDDRITAYVGNRAGPASAYLKTVEELHGGWPAMRAGTPCKDTNGDGIPDAWMVRYFGNATPSGLSAGDRTPTGYLLIEHYLNGTNPTQ